MLLGVAHKRPLKRAQWERFHIATPNTLQNDTEIAFWKKMALELFTNPTRESHTRPTP